MTSLNTGSSIKSMMTGRIPLRVLHGDDPANDIVRGATDLHVCQTYRGYFYRSSAYHGQTVEWLGTIGAGGHVIPDPSVTVAAIDRFVLHLTIFEMNVENYRYRTASDKQNSRQRQSPGRSARMVLGKHDRSCCLTLPILSVSKSFSNSLILRFPG
ncbi:hypothetical protein [Paraburkholderia fungorum]|jgi:hypothetical protein|uniref:hypothetical protein n=1 Tax=Paraburkholderia fungorum TaxID=134537 RepID=UPI003877FDE4